MNDSKNDVPLILSTRFLLAILFFFGIAIQYTHKTDISVGIVCMVNHSALNQNKSKYDSIGELSNYYNKHHNITCLFQNTTNSKDPDGPFTWSKGIQELILSGYFYGYVSTQLIGGWLSFKFSPKLVFFISMIVGSIGTILVPIFSRVHYTLLIILRVVTGMAQGLMWPTMMCIWSNWAPPNERSRLLGISSSGSQLGIILGFSLSGYLCTHGFDHGWPSIFYIFAILGLVWSLLWSLVVSDNPNDNRLMNANEKRYITNELGEYKKVYVRAPWKSIIKSTTCLALCFCHTCQAWGLLLFMTNLPIYMKEILKFDIKSNSLLSSLPSIMNFILTIISSITSDYLIEKNFLKKDTVRRIFNSVGFFVPSLLMIALSFVTCAQPYLAVCIMTLGLGFSACSVGGGFLVTYNDIAKSYSGILFGLSNTFANLPGIAVPYLVAIITKNHLQSEWQIVFLITSCIYLLGGICANMFITSDVQEWATQGLLDDKKYEVLDD